VKDLPNGLRAGKNIGDRIEIDRLYKIVRETNKPMNQILKDIDESIVPYKVAGRDKDISHLGDRLHWLRNTALHGYNGDVSCEGYFTGLILLIIYSGLMEQGG